MIVLRSDISNKKLGTVVGAPKRRNKMKNNKRFYWLKLKKDFFNSREVKKLRRVAGGDTFTIIFLKLQLLSINTDCFINFEGTEENIYEQISLELDEDIENVKLTISFLLINKLIEMKENDIFVSSAFELVGSENTSAERVRKSREKTKMLHCNTDVTKCNTIETNCNTEKEQEKENQQSKEDKKEIVVDMNLSLKKWNDFSELEKEWALKQASPTAKNKIAVALTLLRTGVKPPIIKKLQTGARKGLGAEEYEKIHGKGEVDPNIKSVKDLIDKLKIGGVS